MDGDFIINISGNDDPNRKPIVNKCREETVSKANKIIKNPSLSNCNKIRLSNGAYMRKPKVNNEEAFESQNKTITHRTNITKPNAAIIEKKPIKKIGVAFKTRKNVQLTNNSNNNLIQNQKSAKDNLKFSEAPLEKNPLQIGLQSKRHPAQQDLISAVGEAVLPNIETVFSDTSWDSFGTEVGIHPHLISIINTRFKFKHPTSIQVASIKNLIEGRDALIKAQTGSGKTLAYALPMLHNLMKTEPPITRQSGPRCIIILPTRELATQTFTMLSQLCGACVRIVPGCLIGGAKRKNEKASIRKGLNIIVSTPRRLLDHLSKTSSLHLRSLKWLVIDEADRLVELGFERDVRRIIEGVVRETTPEGGESSIQTVLLSATLTPGVEKLAGLALRNPVTCEVTDNEKEKTMAESGGEDKSKAQFSLPSGLKQFLLVVPCKQRLVALAAFLLLKTKYNKKSGKLIVFFATQDCVDFHHRLFCETLCKDGAGDREEYKSSDLNFFRLHGNMDPKERHTVFQAYSNCPNGVLLTTDVASRGLDLAGVAWVVQYHVSGTPVDYVHRVGRTARAGGRGKALLFLQPEEESFTDLLASTVGVKLTPLRLADVLQTALYHLQSTMKKTGMSTIEEAAASMSKYFLQTVNGESSGLKVMAENAYVSFLRAYASFTGEMRAHFTFHRLHLGHVARAFCLSEAPSQIGKGKPLSKQKETSNGAPSATKRSRRLDLDEEDGEGGYRPSKKKIKTNPAKLAEKNMLAEYGL